MNDRPEFAAQDFDDRAWKIVRMPGTVPGDPRPPHWLRRKLELPADADRTQLALTLGAIQDVYQVYVNGVRIGATGNFDSFADAQIPRPRTFDIPASSVVGTGPLVIALRIRGALVIPPSWRLQDTGPYLLTNRLAAPRQAAAFELNKRWINLSPGLIFGAIFASLGVVTVFFWVSDRSRTELLWFALVGFTSAWASCFRSSQLLADSFPFTSAGFPYVDYLFTSLFQVVTASFALAAIRLRSRLLHVVLWTVYVIAMAIVPWSKAPLSVLAFGGLWPVSLAGIALLYHWRTTRTQHMLHFILFLPLAFFALGWLRTLFPRWLGTTDYRRFSLEVGPFWIPIAYVFLLFVSAITLALLYRRVNADMRERHRLSSEFEAARILQQLLVSRSSVRDDEIHAIYEPAQEVGGDFYQIIPLADGSKLIAAGDVSGKGLKAAMIVSLLTGALRNRKSDHPAAILGELNRALYGSMDGGFVTAVVARLFPDGRLVLANAGHPSPYLAGEELTTQPGLPLGILGDAEYEEHTAFLLHSNQLTFVSDGVIEAMNATGQLFGFDRTREVSTKSAREIADAERA